MNLKIGFIGAGNMGKAMMKGILSSGQAKPEEIFVYDAYPPSMEAVRNELGVTTVSNESEVVQNSEYIILAVKPDIISRVLDAVKDVVNSDKVIISVAAGTSIDKLSSHLPEKSKVIRVMPNTPALVGAGMSALAPNEYVTEEERQTVLSIFESFGAAEIVGEKLMDAVTGISGSGPAYVYLFIEALADGAVVEGMPRPQAYKFAAQTVLGAAKMVLETGKHPEN